MVDRECSTCGTPLEPEQKRFCSRECHQLWFKENPWKDREPDSWEVYDYSNHDPEDLRFEGA